MARLFHCLHRLSSCYALTLSGFLLMPTRAWPIEAWRFTAPTSSGTPGNNPSSWLGPRVAAKSRSGRWAGASLSWMELLQATVLAPAVPAALACAGVLREGAPAT